ncbi:MAG: hypothetical protein AAF909_09265 [Pseudomonadota bacterium]
MTKTLQGSGSYKFLAVLAVTAALWAVGGGVAQADVQARADLSQRAIDALRVETPAIAAHHHFYKRHYGKRHFRKRRFYRRGFRRFHGGFHRPFFHRRGFYAHRFHGGRFYGHSGYGHRKFYRHRGYY